MMKCACVTKNDHFFGAMCLSCLLLSSHPSETLKKRKNVPTFNCNKAQRSTQAIGLVMMMTMMMMKMLKMMKTLLLSSVNS